MIKTYIGLDNYSATTQNQTVSYDTSLTAFTAVDSLNLSVVSSNTFVVNNIYSNWTGLTERFITVDSGGNFLYDKLITDYLSISGGTIYGDLTATTFYGYLNWNYLTNTPTTLTGYGITDATSFSTFASHTAATNPHLTSFYGLVDTGHSHLKSEITDFVDSNYVHTTGDETISGAKIFRTAVWIHNTSAMGSTNFDALTISSDNTNSGSTTSIYFNNGSGYNVILETINMSSGTYLNQDFRIRSTGYNTTAITEKFRITSQGYVGIGTSTPNSFLQVTGSTSFPIVTVSTTYAPTNNDYTILCNATTAAFVVTLPTAVGIYGRIYNIKKTDITSNFITIATTSSQLIDANTTFTLYEQYETVTVQSNNANWVVINSVTFNKAYRQTNITGNQLLTFKLPAKYKISSIVLQETNNATAGEISIGSTAAGNNIVYKETMAANAVVDCGLGNEFFSLSAPQDLYISSSAWGTSRITVNARFERVTT